ncbi:MAG: NADH-quinone oxidoreductase subunit A [Planctomycetia bacterium]|nr:NADH-quinone oxidoreductase subunit A [Planctomycetia bacterium]
MALFLGLIMMVLSKIIAKSQPYQEKNAPYECGFEPVGTAPRNFNVKFYLIAILFVIFDLEIALLFPWALNVRALGVVGYVSAMVFLLIVTFGFIYEWKNGALDY